MCFSTAPHIKERRRISVLLFLCFALMVTGCGEVNQEDFESIETGMSINEVHALLGPPQSSSSGQIGDYFGVSDIWYTQDFIVTVQYLNNEVKLKTIEMRDVGP
ncbi:MAG: hypothetical protein P1U67_11750 [Alcanivoracaceae bacterium]|nr:hypothetical protein [Alcanivoracaceae bacterium]